jgi:hypothetical protein
MMTRLVAVLAFIALSLTPYDARGQQPTAAADTIQTPSGPTADAAQVGVTRPVVKHRSRAPLVFYGALGGTAAAIAVFHVDPDSGGYNDSWTTSTDFPDKAVHALAAWAITNVGIDLGVRARYSAAAVCAAGTAFEFAQGYVSVYDVAADCLGAAGAAAWQSWRARRRARATHSR